MAELLACPKLPDTRRRSGSATIAMPGSRSAVIQRLASAGAAAEMMERPHHLLGISSTRRVSSKREKFVNVQRYFLIRGNPLQGGLQKNHAHPYLTSAMRGASSGSEGGKGQRAAARRRQRTPRAPRARGRRPGPLVPRAASKRFAAYLKNAS